MVRKSTIHRNPIGSHSEALQRQRSRQSLRRHIMDAETVGLTMNTDSLVELNPKLGDVSHTTRVAYAKFMTTKVKKEIQFEDDAKVQIENEKIRGRELKAFNKFKEKAGILKKPAEKVVVETAKSSAEPPTSVEEPSVSKEESKDFRSRTPIEETDEDIQTPEKPSTPDSLLDIPDDQTLSPDEPGSPTPTPQITVSPMSTDNRKADSPMVKPKSSSNTSEQKSSTPELPKTAEGDV